MALTKEKKTKLVGDYRVHAKDSGSPSVQIALLTQRIQELTEHLKKAPKDFASRQGLFRMVGQRRQLLTYMKRTDETGYQTLIQRLEIRK